MRNDRRAKRAAAKTARAERRAAKAAAKSAKHDEGDDEEEADDEKPKKGGANLAAGEVLISNSFFEGSGKTVSLSSASLSAGA